MVGEVNNVTTFAKGDKVFVVDWGKQYSRTSGNGVFWKDLPQYSSTEFFWEIITENKSKSQLRRYEKVIARNPVWQNFKWEVVDWKMHPKAGEESSRFQDGTVFYYTDKPIYLLKAEGKNCYVEISEDGVSKLAKEQYENEKFNAFREAHLGKWSYAELKVKENKFPKELEGVYYDNNDRVLFGSSYTRGKVGYHYAPAEFVKEGVPVYLHCSILYDGEGNSTLPEGVEMVNWKDLKNIFKLDKVED